MLKMTTTLQKWGDSVVVLLPEEILDVSRLVENETVNLLADETGIKMQKVDAVETLSDLFINYEGSNRCQEIETGAPVGNEVW
jgi:antitoxin component of MazEF toxin-antitoxin module